MYTLRLTTHFSAAHQLTNAYDKKCNASIHGHNWKVLIEINSVKLQNNMVIDFTKLTSKGLQKRRAQELAIKATARGCQFQPPA